MSLHRDNHRDNEYDIDDGSFIYDFYKEEKVERLAHKRQVRKMLEDRLERKRLKEEIDELDGEFDWDALNR